MSGSYREAHHADLFILIGTTGEIMPASQLPHIAKSRSAKIIEINIAPSNYTNSITDVFIQEKATVAMKKLVEGI